jgi:pimeloyl-ACP methyl ester carboxylesterase
MTSAIPIYLEMALDKVFGLFSPAVGGGRVGVPVLLCAPWGWDEVASYRSRKRWAERLAGAGHPTLRFDLPSTGNSSGLPGDPARLDSWLLALAGSAEWLCESTGTSAISVVGIGLGGLLAREAIARGAPIRELALWGAPASGKAFVREVRAFSRLQARSFEATQDAARRFGFDESAIEAGGFVLSAETIEALRQLAPDDAAPSALRRALLLSRDGVKADAGVQGAMSAAGVSLTVGAGGGWGEMMSHPERSRLSLEVAREVEAWLVAGDGAEEVVSAREDGRPQEPLPPRINLDGGVVERPWTVDLPSGRAFGILAEPSGSSPVELCAVFLNAGAVRMTGPNRMWTETSRRWAERGVRTLRVDLEGIGEADGDETKFSDVGEFYIPTYEDQVSLVLDALEADGIASRFLLVGLCAGGYWSFRVALRDPRVSTAVLLNSGALAWHPDLPGEREARKLTHVWGWRWRWWKGLLRGEIGWTRLCRMTRLMVKTWGRRVTRALWPGHRPASTGSQFDQDFDLLLGGGTRLVMAFSGDEPLHEELRADGFPERLSRWPGIELEILPGNDHTLRPIAAQVVAAELLDGTLVRAMSLGDADGQAASHPGTRQK